MFEIWSIKDNNKNTRRTSITSFWCFYSVFIVNLEHVSQDIIFIALSWREEGGGVGDQPWITVCVMQYTHPPWHRT